MESITKSEITRRFVAAIDEKEDFSVRCMLKNSSTIIDINIKFEEQQTFVDANGVRWIRDS